MSGARIVRIGGPALSGADTDLRSITVTLEMLGLRVGACTIVEADEVASEAALAAPGAVIVVLTGTGAVEGDIVRRVLARLTATRLVLNELMLAALEEHHRRRDRPVPRSAERQALLPQGAAVWESTDGEPVWSVESTEAVFVVIPGAGEIASSVLAPIAPLLRRRAGADGAVRARTFKTVGVSLGDIEERVEAWRKRGAPGDTERLEVTIVPANDEVWVRTALRGASSPQACEALSPGEASIAALLGTDCYGRDADSLEQVVGRLLVERGLTLAVAESCTGGLLGDRLTNVGGASAYFERGVVVYSNAAKQELLGVAESVLRAHGAVSAPCAEAMARGICERAKTQCGLAITGIAGPDGGTPSKPVGTVFIGMAVGDEVESRRFRFEGGRRAVKWQSTQMALDMLRRRLDSH